MKMSAAQLHTVPVGQGMSVHRVQAENMRCLRVRQLAVVVDLKVWMFDLILLVSDHLANLLTLTIVQLDLI